MQPNNPAKPRKLPKQERSRVTVESILIATTRILTEEGYDRFNTNRVAELAGVSVGSLYQYFPNKEALIFALAEDHANEMVQLVQAHLEETANTSVQDLIAQIIKATIAAHAVNPILHKVLNEQIPRSSEMRQIAEKKMALMMRSYLEQRQDQIRCENPDLTVFIVGQTIEALTHSAVLNNPDLLKNGQLEREITVLLSSYLIKQQG
jgi:AcrR family transcriptional regulator